MLDNDDTTGTSDNEPTGTPPDAPDTPEPDAAAPVKKAAAKRTAKAPAKRAAAKKTAAKKATKAAGPPVPAAETDDDTLVEKPKKKAASRKKAVAAPEPAAESGDASDGDAGDAAVAPMVLFQAPEKKTAPPRKRAAAKKAAAADEAVTTEADEPGETKPKKKGGGKKKAAAKADQDSPDTQEAPAEAEEAPEGDDSDDGDSGDGDGGPRRRRRRGGRRRRRPSDGSGDDSSDEGDDSSDDDSDDSRDSDADGQEGGEGSGGSRRRRRRRRTGDDSGGSSDDPDNTVTRVRKPRNPEDEITSIGGSTRLEAKKQRRREGREAGRRRAPIVSEAEFLARREAVDRVMVVRQKDDLTQIGVLEDKVLVEHYVARESQTSLIGNVYLGRVQNVLPSMEAAFIDIGKGRNAVLYAGEVNWSAVGHKDGQPRKIESVLSSGQTILVQVTKDPVGHKGARLTGQVSLPGRFLVYVPEGNTSGISRKLPDTERNRLKTLLKEIVPETAGVIVRTAAEGASEDELTRDVERLTVLWKDIEEKVKAGKSPQLLYGEPDLTLKVVRDLFTEDFGKLVVQGDDAWDLVEGYVSHVAPDLQERLERFEPASEGKDPSTGSGQARDLFATYRVDEQIAKGLDRKVWLPSGGSLIIDRTEAMTVVDVNTGKFTGSGGNLEETVTKNNLEAAEEIVRQLRLRDIGGIIVVDFIDMVLESNRDLVLRRLVECLGRDRTRHQVAEVTSLGLVQMTRKRIGTGLLEAFSHECEHCKGRGVIVQDQPVESGGSRSDDDEPRGRRSRGGRSRSGRGANGGGGGNGNGNGNGNGAAPVKPSPADLAHSRPPEKSAEESGEGENDPHEQPEQSDLPDVAEPVAEQNVIGTPSDTPPEPVDVPSDIEPESLPDEGPSVEPAAPEPPRLVTSTRRRTARRPAGPPAAVTEAISNAGAGTEAGPAAEPVDVPVEPAGPQHQSTDETDSVQDEPDEQDVEQDGDEDGDEDNGGFSLMHVPIKRKGSRKR